MIFYLYSTVPNGSVTFDAKALSAIVEQGRGGDIWLNLGKIETSRLRQAQQDALKGKDVQQSYDIYVTSDTDIHLKVDKVYF